MGGRGEAEHISEDRRRVGDDALVNVKPHSIRGTKGEIALSDIEERMTTRNSFGRGGGLGGNLGPRGEPPFDRHDELYG